MIFNEEISPTLMKGLLQSIGSDWAMSGRTPANHYLYARFSDVWYPERLSDLHMVTQPASTSHLGDAECSANRLLLRQTTEGIFISIAQISNFQ